MALAYFQLMCSPSPSDVEDPSIQTYMNELIGRPRPVQTILEFLRQNSRQHTNNQYQTVLHNAHVSLNHKK